MPKSRRPPVLMLTSWTNSVFNAGNPSADRLFDMGIGNGWSTRFRIIVIFMICIKCFIAQTQVQTSAYGPIRRYSGAQLFSAEVNEHIIPKKSGPFDVVYVFSWKIACYFRILN
jgi:hypothetical protein